MTWNRDIEPSRLSAHARPLLRRLRSALVHPLSDPAHVPGHLVMGRETYGEPKVIVGEGDTRVVRIGAFCSIGTDVTFLVGGNHRTDWISTFPFRLVWRLPGALEDGHPATKGDIEVGNDVWFGRDALVLSGVRIGNGAVIAARAVVTKDVRPYAVVAGNPAREVRRRFSDADVERLEALRWWDWPLERISEAVPMLNGSSIDELVAFAQRVTPPSAPGETP